MPSSKLETRTCIGNNNISESKWLPAMQPSHPCTGTPKVPKCWEAAFNFSVKKSIISSSREEERFWRTGRKETGFWYQLAHSRESSQSLECQYVYQYDPAMYIIMLLIHYWTCSGHLSAGPSEKTRRFKISCGWQRNVTTSYKHMKGWNDMKGWCAWFVELLPRSHLLWHGRQLVYSLRHACW